jgi:uncharacterized protein
MTRMNIIALALLTATASPALAQSEPVIQIGIAMAQGSVGEQSDGYLGIATTVPDNVRAELNSINIKRRAAYTELAAKRGVTVADAAAATACQTLATRVKPGQTYRIGTGPWQTRGTTPIALPDYCASPAG